LLVNAYINENSTPTNWQTVMVGGSGSDVFSIISSDSASAGDMRTTISDLGTGDKIDLAFLESMGLALSGANVSSVFTTLKVASLTSAGTVISLKDLQASTAEVTPGISGDPTDQSVDLGNDSQILVSNSTVSKTSSAITAGFGASASFGGDHLTAIFGQLDDTHLNY